MLPLLLRTASMGGVTAAGENPKHPAQDAAYEMGKRI